jgi:hypothetical protein
VGIECRVDRRDDRVDDDEPRTRLVDEPLERGDVARELHRIDRAEAVVDDLVDAAEVAAGCLDARPQDLLGRILEAHDDDVAGFTEEVAAGNARSDPGEPRALPEPADASNERERAKRDEAGDEPADLTRLHVRECTKP